MAQADSALRCPIRHPRWCLFTIRYSFLLNAALPFHRLQPSSNLRHIGSPHNRMNASSLNDFTTPFKTLTVLRELAAEALAVQTKAVGSVDAAKIASRELNAWGQQGALGTDGHDDGDGVNDSVNLEEGQWAHSVTVETAAFLRTTAMALAVLEDGCLSDGISLGDGSTAGGRRGGVVTQIVTETRVALGSLSRSMVALLQGLGNAYFSTVESVEKSLFLVLNISYLDAQVHEAAREPSPWQDAQLLREQGLGYDHGDEFISVLQEQRDLLVTMLLVRGGFGDLLALRSEAEATVEEYQTQPAQAFVVDPQRAHYVEGVLDGP